MYINADSNSTKTFIVDAAKSNSDKKSRNAETIKHKRDIRDIAIRTPSLLIPLSLLDATFSNLKKGLSSPR